VLDQRAAFEDGDVRDPIVPLVHDHQVATGRATLAVRPAAPQQGLVLYWFPANNAEVEKSPDERTYWSLAYGFR